MANKPNRLKRAVAALISAALLCVFADSQSVSANFAGSQSDSSAAASDTRTGVGELNVAADVPADGAVAAEVGEVGELGAAWRALPAGGVDAMRSLSGAVGHLSADVANTHETQLSQRADGLSYANQIAASKYLATSAYRVEAARRDAFAAEYGESAGELDEEEIAALYDDDFFGERLRELGFYRDENGRNDALNRRNGLIRAQSAHNIPITAELDLETKRALLPGTDYLPRDLIDGEHPDGRWVAINKSTRILTIYDSDQVYKKYPIAVGSRPSLTPEGQFTFVSKYKNPRWGGGGYAAPVAGGSPSNPLGKRWLGLSKGGGGRYGVHGNASPNSIGTNASHGCIRMINQDVEEMYEYIELGTPVWIGTTEKLGEWGISQQLGCWVPELPEHRQVLYSRAIMPT